MNKNIGLHMIVGLILVFTPLFGIVHELGHVLVNVALGAEFYHITWTSALTHPNSSIGVMAGPIVEILFVYALGHFFIGLDTSYTLFFPAVMHGGTDWENAEYFGFNGELLFLIFTVIMVVLSIRRVRNAKRG